MFLSDLFSRRRKPDVDAEGGADGPVHPSKALARFLAALSSREQPVLVDLGPVVGGNVTFFGEQLGCKIVVEELSKDIDRHVVEGHEAELPAFLATRLVHAPESVDGILCWDVFDYLDRKSAEALAPQLVRMLKPDGVLLGFFATTEPRPQPGVAPTYAKHVVLDSTQIQLRPYPASRGRQRPLQNRDILRIFEPMRVSDQFLLKMNTREVLLRKPSPKPAPS